MLMNRKKVSRVEKKLLNDVETQTDEVSVNVTQLRETKELFVYKTRWNSETTKKVIEIHDLILKIEDEDNWAEAIVSPKFQLAGKDFSVDVVPDDDGYIGVHLASYSDEDQICSFTVMETSGVEMSWEMEKIEADSWWGFPTFLAHKKYRGWAKSNGDVLRLEVTITLHTKAVGDGWTR